MTNSPLVDYTLLSPNFSYSHNRKIEVITIHCTAGQITAEGLGDWFSKKTTYASSNYGVDRNGRIGLYVEEKNRSWASSNSNNDNRAVTIEVSSDPLEPYAVNDTALNKTIDLVVDICKRNGKSKTVWINDKQRALSYKLKDNEMLFTVHRWFANKSCPGEYLMGKMQYISDEVNRRLGGEIKKMEKKEQTLNPTKEVSKWAESAREFVKTNKISDGTNPKHFLTREEAWVMMERLYHLLSGK